MTAEKGPHRAIAAARMAGMAMPLQIATSLLDVAARSRDYRLSELYCGFDRDSGREIVS